MVYGDANGYALADDVVAHELTHGVTAYESGLVYYYQAGAINESLSDVWGEFVDQTNGAGTDTLAVKWQIGEDITGLGAFRNMADPTIFGDPDRIGSTNYDCDESYNNDNGGVHTNSGVNNKAAYLMVDGGTFNTYTVTALGITKVAKIYYEAQTNLLLSASDYNDLYNALQQACTNLVGTSGITVRAKDNAMRSCFWNSKYSFLIDFPIHHPRETANAPTKRPITLAFTPSHNAPPAATAAPAVQSGQCARAF